jgi:hypothetical protein
MAVGHDGLKCCKAAIFNGLANPLRKKYFSKSLALPLQKSKNETEIET